MATFHQLATYTSEGDKGTRNEVKELGREAVKQLCSHAAYSWMTNFENWTDENEDTENFCEVFNSFSHFSMS